MGGPALHPPSVPNLKAGLGQNAAVLALPARRAECERKARLELQTKLEAGKLLQLDGTHGTHDGSMGRTEKNSLPT